jgi:hypothetical protein
MTEFSRVKALVRCESHVSHNPLGRPSFATDLYMKTYKQCVCVCVCVCVYTYTYIYLNVLAAGYKRTQTTRVPFLANNVLFFSYDVHTSYWACAASSLPIGHAQLPIQGFPRRRRTKTMKYTHLYLGPRCSMCGAVLPCFLHVLMTWCFRTSTADLW